MILAQQKGATIKQIFQHLDKDGGGSVSIDELFEQLKVLPNFKGVKNEEDLKDLLKAIDSDGSGDISFVEFEQFINGEFLNESTSVGGGGGGSTRVSPRPGGVTTPGSKGGSKSPGKAEKRTIYEQIRETFGAAKASGLSFDQFFKLFDRDHSGSLSIRELEAILHRIPSFKHLSYSDVRTLFEMIDTDHSGLISMAEFKSFVEEGRKDYISDKDKVEEMRKSRDQHDDEDEDEEYGGGGKGKGLKDEDRDIDRMYGKGRKGKKGILGDENDDKDEPDTIKG
jgi:Ca2+-binding EF-hand superfamily protein